MRIIKLLLVILCLGEVKAMATISLDDWQFVNRLGTIWLVPPKKAAILDATVKFRGDVPPIEGVCEDLVELVYAQSFPFALSEQNDEPLSLLFNRVGKWSVKPLHIWGYEDILGDGCKTLLGWGTAFVVAMSGDNLIWATVEHNVATRRYWPNTVATNWFIKDNEGNWKELLKIGCQADKYCLLISSSLSLLPINLFDDDYVTNTVQVLDKTYLYGCSLVAERIIYRVKYKIHHFCIGNEGYVNSPNSLPFKAGGDMMVSNGAMPGFSGAPVMVYRGGRFLVIGVVNSGQEGVFTAVQFLDEDIISKIKDWLRAAKNIFEKL